MTTLNRPDRSDPNPVAPRKTPDRFNPLERRIHEYLYETLHGCNRTEIARVTGLSRSQVSRVVSNGRGVEGFVKVLLILCAGSNDHETDLWAMVEMLDPRVHYRPR